MKDFRGFLNVGLIAFVLILLASPVVQVPYIAEAFSAQALKPLSGATVMVEGDNGFAEASTGFDGVFTVTEGLGEGSYVVHVSARGYISKVLSNVIIKAGAETDLGDITLQPSGVVRGRVVGPDGEPISGALVSIILNDEVVSSTFSGADGAFTFDSDLVSGTYKIHASTFSYTGISFIMGVPILGEGEVFAEGYTVGEVTGVRVVEGQETAGVEVKLGKSGIISGLVKEKETGKPVPGVIVLAYQPDGMYGFFGVTGNDGRYRIANNLASGTYNVAPLFPKGYVWATTDAKAVTVTAGLETSNVDFELEKSGIISGFVVYSDGAPAPNATVIAYSDSEYLGSAMTGYDGAFRIDSGLGTGTYMVMAYGDGLFTFEPVEVDVEAGKETSGVRLTLPGVGRPWCVVAGRVTDIRGSPLEDATVYSEGFTASTDEDGRYTLTVRLPIGVTEAQLTVSAHMPGYLEQSKTVRVEAGKTTSGVDFALPRVPSGTLKGRVLGLTVRKTASLSLSISAGSTYVGGRVTLSGSLTPPRAGRVSIMVSKDGGTYAKLAEVSLSDGAYSYVYTALEEGVYSFKAVWPGDDEYEPAESGTVALEVTKPVKTPTSITCSPIPASITYGGVVKVVGQITPAVAEAAVSLRFVRPDGSQFTETVTTYENGTYYREYAPDRVGVWTVEASWPGDEQHLGSSSAAVSFTVGKATTAISISVSSSEIREGDSITVSGSITPSPGSVTVVLTYRSPDGSVLNRTVSSASDGSYADTWSPTPRGSWTVFASWAGSENYEASVSSEVSFTVRERGLCIIATATYGSELAPEVQYLRGFRDGIVLSTFAGGCFMEVFNAWYYSFSPAVAGFIAEHSALRSMVKVILYPLMGILRLSASTYMLFSFNVELGVVAAGLVASSLIGFVYFAPMLTIPFMFFGSLRRAFESKGWRILAAVWLLSLALIVLGEVCLSSIVMMLATGMFVLAALSFSALLGAFAIADAVARLRALIGIP